MNIFNLSFGKDSMATLILVAELQEHFESGYVPVRKKKRATEKQISIEEYLEGQK